MLETWMKLAFSVSYILFSAYFIMRSVQFYKEERYFGFGLFISCAMTYMISLADMIFKG